MKSKKKIVMLLFLIFVTGFATGVGIKFYYEANTFKPFRWYKAPIILNCYGDDFNQYQMQRAIEYWRSRGEAIAFYEHNPPESVCEQSWLEGMIILRKSRKLLFSDAILANTKRYTSFDQMKGAIINYKPGAQNLNLLNEHELGHALGFTPVEEVGHIMHPQYHKMGQSFYYP